MDRNYKVCDYKKRTYFIFSEVNLVTKTDYVSNTRMIDYVGQQHKADGHQKKQGVIFYVENRLRRIGGAKWTKKTGPIGSLFENRVQKPLTFRKRDVENAPSENIKSLNDICNRGREI